MPSASGRGSAALADITPNTKQRIGFAAAPLTLIGALVAALATNGSAHEGRRYTPYYDSAGILTVCASVTGPAVVDGKRYTDDERTRVGHIFPKLLEMYDQLTRDQHALVRTSIVLVVGAAEAAGPAAPVRSMGPPRQPLPRSLFQSRHE